MKKLSRRRLLMAGAGTTLLSLLLWRPGVAARARERNEVNLGLLDVRIESQHRDFERQLQRAFTRAFPDGRQLRIESIPREVQNDSSRLAAVLSASDSDLYLTIGERTTRAAAESVHVRPIIFYLTVDPVLDGFVAAAKSPERNLTGFTSFSPTHSKRWEVLFEAFPEVERIAVLVGTSWPQFSSIEADALRAQAPGRRIEIIGFDLSRPILPQLRSVVRRPRLAIDVPHSHLTATNPFMVIDYVNSLGMPSIYDGTHYVRWGGLASYEADPLPEVDTFIEYMKLVLNDVPLRLIPVRYPSSFTLALNLQTAAASGLTVSKKIVKRANVIVRNSQRPAQESPST